MRRVLRTFPIAAALVALAAVFPACRKAHEESKAHGGDAPEEPSRPPVDHLAPGELLEGQARAFELVLPRAMSIDHAFVDVVYASGPVPVESLARYVRARVRDGAMRPNGESFVFDGVRVPDNPKRLLRIRVEPRTSGRVGADLEIRDVTPPEATAHDDEASRWREVGLTPDGRLLDPQHLR
jgi:hypothetical protein